MTDSGRVAGKAGLDGLCIDTIRFLAVDAVEKAASGHPGMPMGDAPMAHVLWKRFLRHSPGNPLWPGRDRFVLSAGHGSMLLYSLLHLSGYGLTLDDLKEFRQWGSHTPGHPEYSPALGIETTTGPLGQGFATGVGMAMAARYLASRYDRPGFRLFDYNVYAITSDGDMMEGVSNEAASIAGHLGLGSLVYLYSDNRITIEGKTDLTFSEDVGARFKALGWDVHVVDDGNDLGEVEEALAAARAEKTLPSLIIARTNIGFGSPGKQDSETSHGSPLGADEVAATKKNRGWDHPDTFHIPEEVRAFYGEAVEEGTRLEEEWNTLFERYSKEHPELAEELKGVLSGVHPKVAGGALPEFDPKDGGVPTRSASGKFLNAVAPNAPYLIGGSADLGPSNNTELKGFGAFGKDGTGPNIHFGVREHAMGAICNGMALSGALVPYCGTFLVFSDYMRPAIRLAALMNLHVVYVFTHDSIGLGEDGPTHQPIEHIAGLRSIPGLTVIRPADANETVEAWKTALGHTGGPVALVLTRQKVPVLDRAGGPGAGLVSRGAYVLAEASGARPEVILIATGSEVEVALSAREELMKMDVSARVVNMPSWELFEAQDQGYRDTVLPPDVATRVSVEAGSTMGWHRYVGSYGLAVGIDTFGASAPYKTLFEKFGFTGKAVAEKALALLSKNKDRLLDRL